MKWFIIPISLLTATIIPSMLRGQKHVGIGTSTPLYGLHVLDTTTVSPDRNAIFAQLGLGPSTYISNPASIYGATQTGVGVLGVSDSQNGVYGLSTGGNGGATGVNTGTGYGIWGVTSGTGSAGYFDGGSIGKGILVISGASGFGTNNPNSRLTVIQPVSSVPAIDTFAAITSYSYTAQGCLKGAVYGSYNGNNYGTGIQGIGYVGVNNQDATQTFGTVSQDLGVYGSANTAGVEGTSVNGNGVLGYSKSNGTGAIAGYGNCYGVYGVAFTIGDAAAPPNRYGVYGYASGATTNYAGYFSGNIQITGSISKGSGTFKIDHPLDPENKYLYHSFVESPDMMNIYNGNITTDASGTATVLLPEYFEAENRDFRYQLTVIDTTQFAQVRIAKEISENRFVVMTDKPNIRISWMVTGVRQDKYANAHRVVPEVEKEKEFQGFYLHAKEWGMPEEKSIDFLTRPNTNTQTATKRPAAENTTAHNVDQQPAKLGGIEIKH